MGPGAVWGDGARIGLFLLVGNYLGIASSDRAQAQFVSRVFVYTDGFSTRRKADESYG